MPPAGHGARGLVRDPRALEWEALSSQHAPAFLVVCGLLSTTAGDTLQILNFGIKYKAIKERPRKAKKLRQAIALLSSILVVHLQLCQMLPHVVLTFASLLEKRFELGLQPEPDTNSKSDAES